MERIAKFEKVSFEQFKKDWINTFKDADEYNKLPEDSINETIRIIYDSIKLPKRATSKSAGNDFYCPCDLLIEKGKSIKVPTGIRCKMDDSWVLQIYPRSSFGFKYGAHLANTVGIIDADYYNSINEGHIFIKIVNDSALAKNINIESGEAFCQGIFVPYGITVDDDTSAVRNGGIGSTGK